jgi:MYXO-CTERM domain-containing protein
MPSGDGWIALDDLQVSTVPAPGAGALLGLGGVLTVRRRRQ